MGSRHDAMGLCRRGQFHLMPTRQPDLSGTPWNRTLSRSEGKVRARCDPSRLGLAILRPPTGLGLPGHAYRRIAR